MRVLVIGCGNPDRGDDAAAILVVRRLRECGVAAREHSSDGLALIDLWSQAEYVILIDTVVTGAPPGTISGCLGADTVLLRSAGTSSHSFDVASAIELARALDRMPGSLKIYGIEGSVFEAGTEPQPVVLAAAERVANLVLAEVQRLEAGEPGT
ncbi:MAG: hydrogenase maturation protease [Bryobacteraceae bacterium]